MAIQAWRPVDAAIVQTVAVSRVFDAELNEPTVAKRKVKCQSTVFEGHDQIVGLENHHLPHLSEPHARMQAREKCLSLIFS